MDDILAKPTKCKAYSSSTIKNFVQENPKPKYESYSSSPANLKVEVRTLDDLPYQNFRENLISSQRYATKASIKHFSDLVHEITNRHPAYEMEVLFYETLPWFLHPTLHEITVYINGK